MAQAPMISAPLKATSEIDWISPLKNYIRDSYGDDPERFADECATLNRLRQDIRGAGKDTTSGRDMLYRYYTQLELLDLRFPIDEQHIKVAFTWFDAFTHKATSQYSLAFEKASIIFNIAAVLSCHGALQSRSVEAGLKMAYHSFQASAGMFTYINENFLHAPSSDLSRLSVKTLIGIMLAQAQEIFLERQVTDEKKVGLLAKLASQAAYLYSQAVEGVQESINKGVFEKAWLQLVQIKSNYMSSMSQYYQALADDDANNYGIAIARLKVAETLSKEANRGAASFPSSPSQGSNLAAETGSTMVELTKRQLALIQEKLKTLNRDNDFLYHVPVPDEATLSPIPKMPAAKPIPVSELYSGQDIQRITSLDLFSKMVPLAVTEAASLYDEEKAKLVRAESERVDLANGEMAASLDYLRLPGALQVLQGNFEDQEVGPDEDFRTWCDDVAGLDNPVPMFESLAKERDVVKSTLDKSSKQLDMEESVCEKMRSKHDKDWTQQPSSRLTTTLRTDIKGYREALEEGAKTDAQLSAKLKQSEVEFDEMRNAVENGEVDDLFRREVAKLRARTAGPSAEPNLLDAEFDDDGPSVMEQISRVKETLKKLNLLKKERSQVLKDLKDKVHNDDISQLLILNKKSIANFEQKFFQQELEKYRPHQNRLLQANHKQSHLMKELTATFNVLLQDKRVRAEQNKFEAAQRQRTAIVNRYKRAYQDFLDLQAGLASARKWYAEMRETVQSLEKNVETFVDNRRSEGAQLLSRIEQERQANKASQAELEQERLRGLMERMTVDLPPPQSPPKPKGRPDPIFTPGAAPPQQQQRYPPQAAFQAPYQVSASSPAPTQTTYTPHTAYNPAHYGRNPGPTSPPPNQTNFGISGGLRGATSPPPNQSTFSPSTQQQSPFPQSHHQSFPGYVAPQQNQMNRPVSVPMPGQPGAAPQSGANNGNPYGAQGFVLPPPPSEPPPLWAQQTIHYNSQDYPVDSRLSAENMARMSGGGRPPVPPPPQQQQQQQPQQYQQYPQQQQHQHQQQQQQQQQAPANNDLWAGLNQW